MYLSEIAQVVRSKNAGPRTLTLDVMFRSDADYQRVAQAGIVTPAVIADLYGVPAEAVEVIAYPIARAIKVSLPRRTAGDPGDRDVYGAQQHLPLLGLQL